MPDAICSGVFRYIFCSGMAAAVAHRRVCSQFFGRTIKTMRTETATRFRVRHRTGKMLENFFVKYLQLLDFYL